MMFFTFCSRLNPKNVHQRPAVALLCGPHVKGAQGISCGRHLANHDVQVILFLPNFVKMLESITNELSLFSKTQGQQVSSLKGEPSHRVGEPSVLSWSGGAAQWRQAEKE
jgi:enhancer of mRNA-decapping protein 3